MEPVAGTLATGGFPSGAKEGPALNSQDRPNPPVLVDDGWCFVCGKENPQGLRMAWSLDSRGRAISRFRTTRLHQGWIGVVHGGILAAVLDEAMAQRLRLAGMRTLTAKLEVRYRRPTPIDVELLAEGWIESESAHGLRLRALVLDEEGTCYADAAGTCVRIEPRERPADGERTAL
jgi:acyl-coenzyme A thioesterase PaaI-like protein